MNALNAAVDTAIPLIERRLEMQAPFSEDNFRYLVFHGLFKSGMDVVRLALEYPHPGNSRELEKVDTVIMDADGVPETAIEFKYHPNDIPTAMSAGELLKDFARLRDFPNAQRFVVYLTAEKMLKYFNEPCNGLHWLLYPKEQKISDAKIPKDDKLRQYADDWSRPALSQMLLNCPVAIDHRLIVWQVNARN